MTRASAILRAKKESGRFLKKVMQKCYCFGPVAVKPAQPKANKVFVQQKKSALACLLPRPVSVLPRALVGAADGKK
jgi:hypothetical protein